MLCIFERAYDKNVIDIEKKQSFKFLGNTFMSTFIRTDCVYVFRSDKIAKIKIKNKY